MTDSQLLKKNGSGLVISSVPTIKTAWVARLFQQRVAFSIISIAWESHVYISSFYAYLQGSA